MLRYIEQLGLVTAPRSTAGYRLYGPTEVQRLRSLRELLQRYGVGLGEVGFVLRLRREPDLAVVLDGWFDERTPAPIVGLQAEPARSDGPGSDGPGSDGPGSDGLGNWLGFEQAKHEQLLRH